MAHSVFIYKSIRKKIVNINNGDSAKVKMLPKLILNTVLIKYHLFLQQKMTSHI